MRPCLAKHSRTRNVWLSGMFATWLEVWNIFSIQTAPKTALQLVKYKTIICQLFFSYPAPSALRYDKLFRKWAARSKTSILQWDILKEDILVWCVTHTPFRARQQPQSPGTAGSYSSQCQPTSRMCRPPHTGSGQDICHSEVEIRIGKSMF